MNKVMSMELNLYLGGITIKLHTNHPVGDTGFVSRLEVVMSCLWPTYFTIFL